MLFGDAKSFVGEIVKELPRPRRQDLAADKRDTRGSRQIFICVNLRASAAKMDPRFVIVLVNARREAASFSASPSRHATRRADSSTEITIDQVSRARRRKRWLSYYGEAMELDFSKLDGLIPAVIQDHSTGRVLMVDS